MRAARGERGEGGRAGRKVLGGAGRAAPEDADVDGGLGRPQYSQNRSQSCASEWSGWLRQRRHGGEGRGGEKGGRTGTANAKNGEVDARAGGTCLLVRISAAVAPGALLPLEVGAAWQLRNKKARVGMGRRVEVRSQNPMDAEPAQNRYRITSGEKAGRTSGRAFSRMLDWKECGGGV